MKRTHYISTGTVGTSSLVGGLTSTTFGGDFWDGARQGATSAALNHLAHSGLNLIEHNRDVNLQVKATRAFLVKEGYSVNQVEKDIVAHREGGVFSKKFAYFKNFSPYKNSFSDGHYDSYSNTNDAYLSINKHEGKKGSFQLKYYPSRNHSTGIVQSMPGHFFEAGFEWVESKLVNIFEFHNDFLYHMHEGNAINYLKN